MIFLLNAATLQQMNKKEKRKKNTINADKKSAKINMKKLVKRNSRKRKGTFDI